MEVGGANEDMHLLVIVVLNSELLRQSGTLPVVCGVGMVGVGMVVDG